MRHQLPPIDFADLGRAMRRAGCEGYLPYDPESLNDRFKWLLSFAKLLVPEYYFKYPCMDWWDAPQFRQFLAKFPDMEDSMNNDRKWNLMQMLRLCRDVPGDTAECGAYKGASSWIILKSLEDDFRSGRRVHHIFDSFAGLSAPGPADGNAWKKHDLSSPKAELEENLAAFSTCCNILPGWIPERFAEVADKRFAFIHIDVDLYTPTLDSLEFFYPRLNDGGVLICDDYGSVNCPGAKKAVEEFLANKPEKMLEFSACGGWIMKGRVAAPPPVFEAPAI